MFNYDLLKKQIKIVYGTQAAFAKDLKMGRNSLNLKLNNKADFTNVEINKACDFLGIARKYIPKYFFKTEVQKHEQNASNSKSREKVET